MIWTIFIILLFLWILEFSFEIADGLIHTCYRNRCFHFTDDYGKTCALGGWWRASLPMSFRSNTKKHLPSR